MNIRLNQIITMAAVMLVILTSGFSQVHLPSLVGPGPCWKVKLYVDRSPNHAATGQEEYVCFDFVANIGTQDHYRWINPCNVVQKGRAVKEGDQVFMHGDRENDEAHHSLQWELVSMTPNDVGAGHKIRWEDDGDFGSGSKFQNILLMRDLVPECGIPEFDNLEP